MFTMSLTADLGPIQPPTPREMAEQLRRLWRDGDWAILQAVCQSTTACIYNAERYNQALGIVRTESGSWAIRLDPS
jgi:hypothetical protein